MFGSCVLNKGLSVLFVFFIFFPLSIWAQSQTATVLEDGALVYETPDLAAPVIATLKRGALYNVSKGTKGTFHKIRLKSGKTGWVSESDIRPGQVKLALHPKEKKLPPKKPFFASRYRGPVLGYLRFTENTLGQDRSADLLFYGYKFNGFDTVMNGEIYSEGNIYFHVGAPKYYADVTKKDASGFIFMADFLIQTVAPMGRNGIWFYGFGPWFKYSHFDLELPDGTKTISYSANDMTLGAVLNAGYSHRIGGASVRGELKYYWEQVKYMGLLLNVGWEF